MKNVRLYISLISALSLLSISCEKEDDKVVDTTTYGIVQLEFQHVVNDVTLEMDTLKYTNIAGNIFSVTRLQYYISAIEFLNNQGVVVHKDVGIYYVNARNGTTVITLRPVKSSSYTYIRFLIGMDTVTNISYSLPASAENTEMAWPPEMGGGYHFLKLEGRYLNTENKQRGYAMHLGTQIGLVRHKELYQPIHVSANTGTILSLKMEVNSWFDTPYSYNFNTDGNYTMGINNLMLRLATNGKDVIYVK